MHHAVPPVLGIPKKLHLNIIVIFSGLFLCFSVGLDIVKLDLIINVLFVYNKVAESNEYIIELPNVVCCQFTSNPPADYVPLKFELQLV